MKMTTRALELAEFAEHADRVGAEYTLNIRSAEELSAVLTTIGSHNDYDHRAATAALAPFVARAMSVSIHQWASGPRITFHLPYWTHQTIQSQTENPHSNLRTSTPYTVQERRTLASDLQAAGRRLHADEIGMTAKGETTYNTPVPPQPTAVSFWWD